MHDRSTTAGAVLTIDLAALVSNWQRLRRDLHGVLTGAVVKADAYGLGAKPVVQALGAAGCRHFFVAHLDEALALTDILPQDARLFVLNGLAPGAEGLCARHGVVPVLNSVAQARRWQREAEHLGQPLGACLQVDSGMSRLGVSAAEAALLASDTAFRAAVPLAMVMSHLACADDPADPANTRQSAAFRRLAVLFPGVPRSLANSGGCLLSETFHGDIARPGLALYGADPVTGAHFAPVVHLAGRVIQTRTIPAGAAVGYGLTWQAAAPARIATIAVGYADGWLRSLSNAGAVWYQGQRLPIVGRVSMDSFGVDISSLPVDTDIEGAFVELIGPHQSLEDVARDAGTIAYEILTGLGSRYARHYRPAVTPAMLEEVAL